MLVLLALGNAKEELSFALGDAKVPNANDFASQWNIGLSVYQTQIYLHYLPQCHTKNAECNNIGFRVDDSRG